MNKLIILVFAFGFASGCGINDGPSIYGANKAALGYQANLVMTNPGQGNYGTVNVNTANTQTFTVQNIGGVSATLGAMTTAGLNLPSSYALTGGTCTTGMVLASSASCTLIVTYQPHSVASFSGQGTLPYNNGSTNTTVSMSLTGGVNPLVLFSWLGVYGSHQFTNGWSTSNVAAIDGTNVDGGFNNINGLAIDSLNGYFYIVDSSTYNGHNSPRVCKFAQATGAFVGCIGKLTASTGTCPATGASPGWCTGGTFATGTGNGEFDFVNDIALDPVRDVMYLADNNNSRISKYVLSTGAYVGSVGKASASTGTCTVGVNAAWCTGGTFVSGSEDGAFNTSEGQPLAIDATGTYLYTGDQGNFRITKIQASTGQSIGSIGQTTATSGTCPVGTATAWCTGGTFTGASADGSYPGTIGLSVDSTNGFLYAADESTNAISKITLSSGLFVGAIGYASASTGTCAANAAQSHWCTGGAFAAEPTLGSGDGEFSTPYGLAVDPTNNVFYVGDASGNRLEKFNLATGAFIGSQGLLTASTGTCPSSGTSSSWCTGGTFTSGSSLGDYNYPQNAFATTDGYLYVIDNSNYRIVRLIGN